MHTNICAVCQRKTPTKVLYQANFREKDINFKIYTSRRIPDRLHFRIAKCKVCGLTFSNPIYSSNKIIDLYKKSANPDYQDLQNSARVYASYLKRILTDFSNKNRLLDIGCGDGFFLTEAKKLGFKELYGVEPSEEAVGHLQKGLNKKNIINNVFKKGQFKKNFFDVVCFFHVFDHVVDPNEFLKNCYDILKQGGYVVSVMHDSKALTHRILGENSPIFDIQHIYLFDKNTVKKIFEKNGFKVLRVFNITNIYSLGYWMKMFPHQFLRKIIDDKDWPLLKFNIPWRVGNMAIAASKKN